ncbi:MAG TPA: stage II sporulation protein M [Gemmatimonadaceae bacterium]|jgi:uncharacterized membrane protein SpoIIM required for sporulation/uncharacterized RDD family membrane protein YckC
MAAAYPPPIASTSTAQLEQHIDVETPEQVVLSYTVAGVGSRAAAAIIDALVISAFILSLYLLLLLLAWVGSEPGSKTTPNDVADSWVMAVLSLFVFAVQWGYYVLFEAIWDGQTPGKRKLHIRVVQDGGYSVSFGASAVRNVVRVIDMQPGLFYAVGIISAVLSKSGKRLGDMIAGTFVVQERIDQVLPTVRTAAERNHAADVAAPAAAALTADEYDLLGRFLARRAALDADRRARLTEQLIERFHAFLPNEGSSPVSRLVRLYDAERIARGRGVAARGATGAAREHHALVAQSTGRWSSFAAVLSRAQKRGLSQLSEDEVSDFVAQYRDVATDLARLKTASRGRDSDALFYLSRLVAGGHNLLYRQKRLTGRATVRFVAVNVPREIRRSWAFVVAAAACLFVPVGITYRAVTRDPALAESLLPPGMIDRANEGAARARSGNRTYVEIKDFMRPLAASGIIRNNVTVTYVVFAFGITAGIGTVSMLVFNGISIGAALGLYANKGIVGQIGEFVLAHSVFELSAICIAGGGGLLLASALLLPGALTRREALVIKGRRAIRLIAASTLLLIVAGTIEGLISPRTDISVSTKLAIAASCAVVLLAYVLLGGRWMTEASGEEFAYSDERALSSR